MDQPITQHRALEASGEWKALSFSEQMGNVGSEIHRALKWQEKEKSELEAKAFYRALELLDMTIAAACDKKSRGAGLRELLRLREAVCDCFTEESKLYGYDAASLNKYFDCFALKAAHIRECANQRGTDGAS